jgi:hypothetical protein
MQLEGSTSLTRRRRPKAMQTFLPYPDFRKSAEVLDWRRLGNQRNEVLTILRGGWAWHPASKMWVGYFYWLGCYGVEICKEWRRRDYVDNQQRRIVDEMLKHENTGPPWWLGKKRFHLGHQSNLIRKLPEHYGPLFPGVSSSLKYWWPVKGGKNDGGERAQRATARS